MNTAIDDSYFINKEGFRDSTDPQKNSFPLKIIPPAVLVVATLTQPVPSNAAEVQITTAKSQRTTITETAEEIGQKISYDFSSSLIGKVNSFLDYEDNWDGYDGKAAGLKTVNDVISFLDKLPNEVFDPRPALSGDGEISLFWELGEIFVDIGFQGNGSYIIYAVDQDGIEYLKDEARLDMPLPMAILNLISIV